MWMADNFGLINASVPKLLNVVNAASKVLGPTPLEVVSRWMNKMTGNFVPVWNPYMPKGAAPLPPATAAPAAATQQVRRWGCWAGRPPLEGLSCAPSPRALASSLPTAGPPPAPHHPVSHSPANSQSTPTHPRPSAPSRAAWCTCPRASPA
jgi:hypothetical protein